MLIEKDKLLNKIEELYKLDTTFDWFFYNETISHTIVLIENLEEEIKSYIKKEKIYKLLFEKNFLKQKKKMLY